MKDLNIFVFGDSICYGAYDNKLGGWVNRLKLDLEQESSCYCNVYNLGVPGDTTSDLLKRMDNELNSRIDETLKTVIIFSIGINDSGYINNIQNVVISDFRKNIISMIKKAKEYSENIMFCGLTKVNEELTTPVSWDNNLHYYNETIGLYDNVLKKICISENIGYINLSGVIKINELVDGLHPSAIVHRKIEKMVLKKINEIIVS